MISVAMTTYNGERYVKEQIDSILNQTKRPDELIICDDGSEDETCSVIEKIIVDNTTTVKIRFEKNQENLGYVRNFHKAISMTGGDYIFLSDQDDIWHADKIETMIRIMKGKKCGALCTNSNLIDGNGNPISDRKQFRINPLLARDTGELKKITFIRLIFGNIAQGCTYCFTKRVRDAYLRVNHYELIHDQQIMMIAANEGAAYLYNSPLIDYRIHENNAVGFHEKKEKSSLQLRKPRRKPFMVVFLEDLDRVEKVRGKRFFSLLYYLRIPYMRALIRQRLVR